MSFFLKNSQSYVDIVRRGLEAVERVLNASCAVDFEKCSQVMIEMQASLVSHEHCASDYSLHNPLVIQALDDFAAYGQIYKATCLPIPSGQENVVEESNSSIEIETQSQSQAQTASLTLASAVFPITSSTLAVSNTYHSQDRIQTDTSQQPSANSNNNVNSQLVTTYFNRRSAQKATYCYSDALFTMTESTVDDAYIYLLPLGVNFPNTSMPSCSECTRQVMAIFHSYTDNESNVITHTYDSAARIIVQNCQGSGSNNGFAVNSSTIAKGQNGGMNGSVSKNAAAGGRGKNVAMLKNYRTLTLIASLLVVFYFDFLMV